MRRQRTHAEFLVLASQKQPKYTIISQFNGILNKIMVRHNVCGNIYNVEANSFLRGHGCKICFGTIKFTTQEFSQWVYLNRPEYNVVGEYTNNKSKIAIQHKECGRVWLITPHNFKHGQGCGLCFGKSKLTHEQFVNWLLENNLDYEVMETYVTSKHKIKIKHNVCGHIWSVKPNNLKAGSRCPYCAKKTSRAEQDLFVIIKSIFADAQNNVRGILSNKKFELDIFIPSLNKAIEFNGEIWHLRPEVIDRDQRKIKQCQDHNIDLLVVWFNEWISNKQEIVDKCLLFLGKVSD